MNANDIVDIFRRILETNDIDVDSDFFQLGGDSLTATRILSAVARRTGTELTFDDFMAAPTPGSLSEKLACVTV